MVANFIGKGKGIIGAKEFSPVYVLRIFRQFGFTDDEMADLLK
jgi:hypothetical protein